MYILGFSLQIWLVTIAAVAVLVLSRRRKSKGLTILGAVLAIVAVAAIGLQISVWVGGSNETAESEPAVVQSSNTSALNTAELESLIRQSQLDIDDYEMDSAMIAYTRAVSKHTHLLHDATTQEEIDAAVREISELREAVVDPMPDSANPEQLPSYQDMVESIDEHIGTSYLIDGRVTNVSGGFRGADWFVYVYWDDSETHGEVAAVRIPYKSYKDSVRHHFKAVCILEGMSDNDLPQFVCYEYEAE